MAVSNKKGRLPFFAEFFFGGCKNTTRCFCKRVLFFSQPKKLPNFPPLFGLGGDGRVYEGALGPEPQ